MTTEPKHTPTPWTQDKGDPRLVTSVQGGVAEFDFEEDAAACVRAVNRDHAFDGLVEALKEQRKQWELFFETEHTLKQDLIGKVAVKKIDIALAAAGVRPNKGE